MMYWSFNQLPELARASEHERQRVARELRLRDSFGAGFRIGMVMLLSGAASYLTQGSHYYALVNATPLLKILVYTLIILAFLKFSDLVYLNVFLRKRIGRFVGNDGVT